MDCVRCHSDEEEVTMPEHLSKSDLKLCSLKGCLHPAAFDIFAGPDHFTTEVVARACAFDREAVMDVLRKSYPNVQWHDVD